MPRHRFDFEFGSSLVPYKNMLRKASSLRDMFSVGGSEVTSDNSQSVDTLEDDNTSYNPPAMSSSSIYNQTPWYKMPEMSLLDLTFKLKEAETRVYGREKKLLDRSSLIETDTTDVRDVSDLYCGIEPSAKKVLLEINEKYRQLEASFPRNLNGDEGESIIAETPSLDMDLSRDFFSDIKTKKRFGCGWCSYNTDSKSHLHRHHKAMHKECDLKIVTDPQFFSPQKKTPPIEGKRKHQCDMCSYQTDCKSHLRRHQGSVHCKDKLYHCSLCNIEFSRSEKAKEHHYTFHPEKSFDIRNMRKPAPLIMDTETGRPSSQDKMEKIRQLYQNSDKLFGSFRGRPKASSSRKSLGVAAMNSSDEQACDESEGLGNGDAPWTMKKRTKARNNSFVCLKCDYSCRDLWHLRRHVVDVHSADKEHNCKVCHYATSRHHRLFLHMLKHGELFCNGCDFSSVNPEIYKLHIQVCAVVQKTTKCSICPRDFDDFASYKTHVSTEHSDLLVNCPKCQFFTESSKELQAHLGLHVWEDRVCRICSVVADGDEAFARHCSDKHLNYDSDWSQTWICSECGHGESGRNEAVAHVATHFPTVRECSESGCPFRCYLELSMEQHLKYMHHSGDDKSSMMEYIDQLAESNATVTNGKQGQTTLSSSPVKTELSLHLEVEAGETGDEDLSPRHEEGIRQCSEPLSHSRISFPSFGHTVLSSTPVAAVPVTSLSTVSPSYSCPYCPERPPFRYKKSFEKHISQHTMANGDRGDGK